jgi:molecular chaperone GrpE
MEEKELINENQSSEVVEQSESTIDPIVELNEKLQQSEEKYLRLYAEFDNFKRRNAKERVDLIQTAGRDVIQSMLEVMDDCDRAEKQLQTSEDLQQIRQGIQIVFTKLRNTLQAKGVKEMKSIGEEFNPDIHEAITEIPVNDPSMVGKVVDEVEKGYTLNEKIIRYSKVVVGK